MIEVVVIDTVIVTAFPLVIANQAIVDHNQHQKKEIVQ